MEFLKSPPRHLFFTGKGGVGKTSIACATAVALARQGASVLLVSTDPASNVAQVFGQEIGNQITAITHVPHLSAIEINPDQAAEAYRNKILNPVRNLLPQKELDLITEQLSGSCTTEIASFNEFTHLLAGGEETQDFDHVVFDTAPTGHTIRLLKLPGDWTQFLDKGQGDASCLGPMSGLEKNQSTYRAAVDALTRQDLTRIVLVARPQTSTLREVARTTSELAALNIHPSHLVLNSVLPEHDSQDPLYSALLRRERTALENLPSELAVLTRDTVDMKDTNVVGLAALDTFFDPMEHTDVAPPTIDSPLADLGMSIDAMVDKLATSGHGLIMTMGKGGVGKTTIASALALALANRGHQVRLTTTDPAAHLASTLDAEVENLTVDAIDPQAATQAYRERVMATKGKGLDENGRAALWEDLMSPCTEEIAVFQQFSRAVNEARRSFVVMDTAPTGHTLLLMDATGSYHREITRHMDEVTRSRHTTPLMRLQDPEHTKILVVTLAETTPVLEAEALVADLQRADIAPWGWVINNSLTKAGVQDPLLSRRAAAETELIERVRGQAERLAIVPTLGTEPVGTDALSQLATG